MHLFSRRQVAESLWTIFDPGNKGQISVLEVR
jgi:hypothetical protein